MEGKEEINELHAKIAHDLSSQVREVANSTGHYKNALIGYSRAFADELDLDSQDTMRWITEAQEKPTDRGSSSFDNVAKECRDRCLADNSRLKPELTIQDYQAAGIERVRGVAAMRTAERGYLDAVQNSDHSSNLDGPSAGGIEKERSR